MAGILESLEPLVELVELTDDPLVTCSTILARADEGDEGGLMQALGDTDLAGVALRYAGVLNGADQLKSEGRDQLLRLETVVRLRAIPEDRWMPVMTVPAYLRGAMSENAVTETFPLLLDLISRARRRVVMASPFLDAGFENLIPVIARFTADGGRFLLITRELTRPESRNLAMVRLLRERCSSGPDLEVVSWEEEGLGLHLKAAVADSSRAYVGSANFTTGGMSGHAELGLELTGPSVADVERILEALAGELRKPPAPPGTLIARLSVSKSEGITPAAVCSGNDALHGWSNGRSSGSTLRNEAPGTGGQGAVEGFEEARALREEVNRLRALVEDTVRWLRDSGHPVKAAALRRTLDRAEPSPRDPKLPS